MAFSIKKVVNKSVSAGKTVLASKAYQATLGKTFNIPTVGVINTVGKEVGNVVKSAASSTSALLSNAQAIQPQVAQLASNAQSLAALAENPLGAMSPQTPTNGGFSGYAPTPEKSDNTMLYVILGVAGLAAIILLRK